MSVETKYFMLTVYGNVLISMGHIIFKFGIYLNMVFSVAHTILLHCPLSSTAVDDGS